MPDIPASGSSAFETFLKDIKIPDEFKESGVQMIFAHLISSEFGEWKKKQVYWYPAPRMNSEQRRRLIGNTLALIFFLEERDEWDLGNRFLYKCLTLSTDKVDKLGNITRVYAVVQPAGQQYRYSSSLSLAKAFQGLSSTPVTLMATHNF